MGDSMKLFMSTFLSLSFLILGCAGADQHSKIPATSQGKIIALSTATPAPAANGLPNTLVQVEMVGLDSLKVLKMFFEEAHLKYELSPSLPSRAITLQVKDLPWSEAFNMVIASAGYDYSIDSSGLVHVTTVQTKKAH
jgi:hypothetical protein